MRRDPAAQFWGFILALGIALLLGGIGVLSAVAGQTTDTLRWVGIGLVGSGVFTSLIAGGGFVQLFLELRSQNQQETTTASHPVSVERDIQMGLALVRVRNDGPATDIQIQVEKLEGLDPESGIFKRLFKLPYTAPWLSLSDKIKNMDWNERRSRRLLNGATETVGLMTAWGPRLQLWGVEFHDGHIWAVAKGKRRHVIRFQLAVLVADRPPQRHTIEFRRTTTGLTIPRQNMGKP